MQFLLLLFALFFAQVAFSQQVSNKEIIERLTRLEEGQKNLERRLDELEKNINQRIDDVHKRIDDVHKRLDDVMTMLQIIVGGLIVIGGGILGWVMIIWRRLVKVEERHLRFETVNDEIKFLKEAYARLNELVIKLVDALKPPKGAL